MREKRTIIETGIDARIATIVEPEIEAMGFRLVRVRLSGANGLTLQIMAERPDGMISVGECESISRAIGPILDVEDPVDSAYHLEISSPGIDRPLVRISDFESWTGYVAKLETRQLINGRKRYKGTIISVDGENITFRRVVDKDDETPEFTLPIGEIQEARLILSDELINEALKRDKELRKANGIEDNKLDEIEDAGSGNETKH